MPVSVKAHHCQLPATPSLRTMSVTRLGVSLANVVATMDNPASHHGTARPDTKNSEVLLPARLPKKSAGEKQSSSVRTTMTQSMKLRCMCSTGRHYREKDHRTMWDCFNLSGLRHFSAAFLKFRTNV